MNDPLFDRQFAAGLSTKQLRKALAERQVDPTGTRETMLRRIAYYKGRGGLYFCELPLRFQNCLDVIGNGAVHYLRIPNGDNEGAEGRSQATCEVAERVRHMGT